MGFSSPVLLISLLAVLPTIRGIDGIEYTVTNRAEGTKGGKLFQEKIGTGFAKDAMRLAKYNIEFWIFRPKDPSERKDVKSISLFIDEMDGLVSTHHVKGKNHEIHLSAWYIERSNSRILQEFHRVIYYEIAHVLQWTANGDTPAALVDGIATYAVHFILGRPESGSTVRKTDGWSWKKSPEVISQLLFFCDEIMSDFVAALNKKMKASYSDKYFDDLLNEHIDVLWEKYKAKYGEN